MGYLTHHIRNMEDGYEQLQIVCEEFLDTINEETQKNLSIYEKIKANYKAVKQIREQMQEQVKRDIEALTSQYQEQTKDNGSEINLVVREEQQLQQDLKEVENHNQELSAHCKAVQESLENMKEEKERCRAEKERFDNETTVVLPKRREEISLYQNISRIRFDFDCPEAEVKGYIVNKNDVKPFQFAKQKSSDYFITNALWDCMKEED